MKRMLCIAFLLLCGCANEENISLTKIDAAEADAAEAFTYWQDVGSVIAAGEPKEQAAYEDYIVKERIRSRLMREHIEKYYSVK